MNKEKKGFLSKIGSLIFFIITIVIILKLYSIYKQYNFNEFQKVITQTNITKFTRDKEVKFSEFNSYKLESTDFNDAMFYKEIEVKPNTPYKLTCMVKTENVEPKSKPSLSGAQMCILDTTECSDCITGTNDWQKLEFMFNSKNRETVKVGFRLGGNKEDVKGTAWFSDFKLESGIANTDTNWNVACFILKNVDVNIDNEHVKLSMDSSDVETMKYNINRFKKACKELSNNQMTVTYDVFEIDEPVKTISYSQEYGYYVDPVDVKDIIRNYINKDEYDHIFVAVRLGNDNKNVEIPVNDWIGLRKYGY